MKNVCYGVTVFALLAALSTGCAENAATGGTKEQQAASFKGGPMTDKEKTELAAAKAEAAKTAPPAGSVPPAGTVPSAEGVPPANP